MSFTIVNLFLAWFFSCPTVLEAVFFFAVFIAVLFTIVGYTSRED